MFNRIAVLIILIFNINVVFSEDMIKIYIKNHSNKETKEYYLRKIIDQNDNSYVIQDFYKEGMKKTSPYKINNKEEVNTDNASSIDGDYTEWYRNGAKRRFARFKNGTVNGMLIAWYENGTKTHKSYHYNDAMTGPFIAWYENGQKKSSGGFCNNKQVGVWTYWDEKGKIIKEIYWGNNGEKIKEVHF